MEYRPAQPGKHYELIVAATWAKVRQNPEVQRVLLATGDLVLRPDHYQEPNAPAAWRYYDILSERHLCLEGRDMPPDDRAGGLFKGKDAKKKRAE